MYKQTLIRQISQCYCNVLTKPKCCSSNENIIERLQTFAESWKRNAGSHVQLHTENMFKTNFSFLCFKFFYFDLKIIVLFLWFWIFLLFFLFLENNEFWTCPFSFPKSQLLVTYMMKQTSFYIKNKKSINKLKKERK